ELNFDKNAFENASSLNAVTSNILLEFTQKTPLNNINIKTFITFIVTKSPVHLVISPENALSWFAKALEQVFVKKIVDKYSKDANNEINDFKIKKFESRHFGFWSLVASWNLEKITREEFASSPYHPAAVRKRIRESEDRDRLKKRIKANLDPKNEFICCINAILDANLDTLLENEPLRNAFKLLRKIDDQYRMDLPSSINEWFLRIWNSSNFLTMDLASPKLNKENFDRSDEIFFNKMICSMRNIILKYQDICLNEVSEETWLIDTIQSFLEAVVSGIFGLSVHSQPDRTIRLKVENIEFEILYVEGASPTLRGKKPQEDAEKLQQLVKLNLDEVLRNIQYCYGEKMNGIIKKKIFDIPLITIQSTQTSLISTISDRKAHPLIRSTRLHYVKIPLRILDQQRGLKLLKMFWEIRNILKINVELWRNILNELEEIIITLLEQRVKLDENIVPFRSFTPGKFQ
ncbi:97_t:CDS:2, partial [Gigaspora margarita]